MSSMCYTLDSSVVTKLVISCRNEAKEQHKSDKQNNEWDISTNGAAQEHEWNDCHNEVVIPLSRVEVLTKQAIGIRTDDSISRIRGVCKNDPMGSVDNEGHEGERVPEDEFCDAGNVHGDSTEEIETCADRVHGFSTASFELQEWQDDGGEGDYEPEDTQERRVS